MSDIFSTTHINDFLIMIWLFAALTYAYRPKVKPLMCAGLFLVCLSGGFGSILLQEVLFKNYLLYMLLFVLWGCVYSAFALRGTFLWKAAMTAVYICIVFNVGKCVALVHSLLPEPLYSLSFIVPVLFQAFDIPIAVFMAQHAVTTERKVPFICWASLMGVALIGIAFAYYQAITNPSSLHSVSAALYSLGIITILLVVEHLCAEVIRSHERDLVRLSLSHEEDGLVSMARQAGTTEEALRRYRHETINHIATLSALLQDGEINKAKALLTQMQESPVPPEQDAVSGNVLVDTIIRQKKTACMEKGIRLDTDLVLSESLPLSDAEISSLLNNLINNAMEAAVHSQSPFIRVRMYPARDYMCLEIVNSADEERLRQNPDMNTTKPEPELHGIGLKVVKEIVQRHQGMIFFNDDKKGRFSVRVMLHL